MSRPVRWPRGPATTGRLGRTAAPTPRSVRRRGDEKERPGSTPGSSDVLARLRAVRGRGAGLFGSEARPTPEARTIRGSEARAEGSEYPRRGPRRRRDPPRVAASRRRGESLARALLKAARLGAGSSTADGRPVGISTSRVAAGPRPRPLGISTSRAAAGPRPAPGSPLGERVGGLASPPGPSTGPPGPVAAVAWTPPLRSRRPAAS